MCGRTALFAQSDDIESEVGSEIGEPSTRWVNKHLYRQSYNVAPTRMQPILYQKDGQYIIQSMKWGLVPQWSKDGRALTINSRDDSVATKPLYRSYKDKARCIVVCQGYYEWKPMKDKTKLPFYYHYHDGGLMYIAAFYSGAVAIKKDVDDGMEPVMTYTLLTTSTMDSNNVKILAEVHDRMPALLHRKEDILKWLDTANYKWADVCDLIQESKRQIHVVRESQSRAGTLHDGPKSNVAGKLLLVRPVSKFVSRTGNDGKDCIADAGSYVDSEKIVTASDVDDSKLPTPAKTPQVKKNSKITDFFQTTKGKRGNASSERSEVETPTKKRKAQ